MFFTVANSIVIITHYTFLLFLLQQESEISNMENRNYFSLHCVQMETQLIHANMEALYYALHRMVHEESKAHAEVCVSHLHLKVEYHVVTC